jgi:RimJ/RimL family protein N-acetyltransferase
VTSEMSLSLGPNQTTAPNIERHLASIDQSGVGAGRPAHTPPLATKHLRLRPLTAADHAWMHAMASSPDLILAWRFRGSTPSPETFARSLWQGVHAQFIVESYRRSATPAAHVVAYNADLHGGSLYFAVTAFPPFLGTGLAMEGSLLFLNYLFTVWRIRKVYIETTDEALATFRSGASVLHEEGRLVAHEYINGRYVDRLTMAIYRAEFRAFLERFRPLFAPSFEAGLA